MSLTRHLNRTFLFLIVVISVVSALSASTRASQDQGNKLSLIIEDQRVRFTTPGEVVSWRLEVSDQQGQPVFDSGFVDGSSLDWSLEDQQGLWQGAGGSEKRSYVDSGGR